MRRSALLLAALGALAKGAWAAGFEPKTMRDNLPLHEVERPLVIGKGWLEFGLQSDVKNASGYWNSAGEAVDFQDATWLYSTQSLAIRYGVSRRSELYWTFRTHYARLSNEAMGTDIASFGLGDPSFGLRRELLRRDLPLSSLIAYVGYKAPAGNESPGNYTAQANSFTNIIFTTGTPDLALGLRGKQQLGPVAVTGDLGWIHRFSNVTQYIVETEQNQFNGRIKPGDRLAGEVELLLQAGPIAASVAGKAEYRTLTKLGVSSAGLTGDRNLEDIADSDGLAVSLDPQVMWNITRGVDVRVGADIPLMGEDLLFFPIEDLTPTRGTTWSGAVELRY